MNRQIQMANEDILGETKMRGTGKQRQYFGTGNTENQYTDYGEQGIKRFIYRE